MLSITLGFLEGMIHSSISATKSAFFLSKQKTSSQRTRKPKNDIIDSVLKQFLEFYNHDNGIWGDPASDIETKAV